MTNHQSESDSNDEKCTLEQLLLEPDDVEQAVTAGDETQPDECFNLNHDTAGGSDQNEADAEGLAMEQEYINLENILWREFGDTLVGFNIIAAPLGVLLIVLAILGWITMPIIEYFEMGIGFGTIVLAICAFLALAGLHLIFYWLVHKSSNFIKSRELDRLIEKKRVSNPCRYLDCTDSGDPYEIPGIPVEKVGAKPVYSPGSDIGWRCTLFQKDLEGLPVCAVCDRYEPENEEQSG